MLIVILTALSLSMDAFSLAILYGTNQLKKREKFLLSSLVGLIPNCAASVALTELFLKNAIGIGTCIAGLLTGSGVAILVLFKSNKNFKENMMILALVYGIGAISGILLEILAMII